MKIVLTGATGFIGSSLVEELHRAGHEILAFSRKQSGDRSGIRFIKEDLCNPDGCFDVMKEFKPEAACHLAWAGIPDFSWEKSLENLRMSTCFFEAVSRIGTCKKIIAAGSCWEFGNKMGLCEEDAECSPCNAFTWAKLSSRASGLILAKERGYFFGWCRLFFVYGSGQRRASLLPSLLQGTSYVKNEQALQDFIYIQDVVEGFRLALENDWPCGDFHFGSGVLHRIGEVAGCVKTLLSGGTLWEPPTSFREGGIFACTSKTKQYLGWQPKTLFHRGLMEMHEKEIKSKK